MMKTVLAIRHVHFEDLGVFAGVFASAGYEILYRDAGVDDLSLVDPLSEDIVVILGAPIGANEEDKYPFLVDELRIIDRRIEAKRPTLGICLGAQMLAGSIGCREHLHACGEERRLHADALPVILPTPATPRSRIKNVSPRVIEMGDTGVVINGSAIFSAECAVEYALSAIEKLLKDKIDAIDCRQQPFDEFNERIDRENQTKAWGIPRTKSWYKNSKGRASQTWPLSLFEYWRMTKDVHLSDYKAVARRN